MIIIICNQNRPLLLAQMELEGDGLSDGGNDIDEVWVVLQMQCWWPWLLADCNACESVAVIGGGFLVIAEMK